MEQQGQSNQGPQTNVGGKVDSAYSGNIDQIGDRYIVNPDRLTNDEVLRALYDRIVGNSIRGVPGLISTVENMAQSIAQIQKDHEALYKDVQSQKSSNEAKFSAQSMWIWLALAILGLEGVAIIVMIIIGLTTQNPTPGM